MEVVGRDAVLDDCAILPDGDRFLVFSTDMVHASTDFPAGMSDWQVGWMSVAVTLSDIAAMGADPADILLAIGLDDPSRLRPILEGAKECCDTYGARFAGGDLDCHRELTLVSSGIGFSDHPVRRAGSRVGDVIGIVGIPGRAQAALEGFPAYREYLFTPRPRVEEGRALARSGVTSMMDVSDGLLVSLSDMLDANRCGYEITTSRIPGIEGIPGDVSRDLALRGGGDFGLLFTCPPEILPLSIPDLFVIGRVIAEPVVKVDGRPATIQGYQHRWDDGS
jgi:thiamine-monophosphate kinase